MQRASAKPTCQGFIKRHYLIAMAATETEPEADAPKRQKV
jgi:hypothetical protein